MQPKWFLSLLLGLALAFFMSRPRQGRSIFTKLDGSAPAWTLKDLDGRPVSSTNFAGRVVVVNFWATWCPPCRAEIPDFVEFVARQDTNRFALIGASVDEGGAAAVKAFAQAYKINYPVVMADAAAQELFGGIAGFPTTFVIGTNGMFVSRHLGQMSKADLARFVEPLIPKP